MKSLLSAFFFYSTFSYGQEVKEFFSVGDVKTTETKSLYYKTGIKTDDGVLYQGKILTYYTATNTIRSEEYYDDKGNLNGEFKQFYETGVLKRTVSYEHGRKKGIDAYFYPNGKTQEEKDHFSRTINYWDSTGTQLVVDGNGFFKCYTDERFFNNSIKKEEGQLVNSSREGSWKTFRNDTLQYEDKFTNGKFLEGINYTKGEPISYNEIEKQAMYNGGMNELAKFLSKNINYPKAEKKQKIEGKVFIEFIVDKEGNVISPKVFKGDCIAFNEEALRVVSQMPIWIPGYERGVPVKSKFVLPIFFRL